MAEYATRDGTVTLSDLSGISPPLFAYVFRHASATATLTGFFVDISGQQIGAAYTGTITTTPKSLVGASAGVRIFALAALPTGAVGFVGTLSANIYYALGGLVDYTIAGAIGTDLTNNPTLYPVMTSTTIFAIGRAG